MLKVIIADDHTIFRQGLSKMLSSTDEVTVIGVATDGDSIWKLILETKPDIVILDLSMPGLPILEIIKRIRHQGLSTKVILLTMHTDPIMVEQSIKAGASGYVPKSNAFSDLLYAISAVAKGGKFISPSITEDVFDTHSCAEELPNILSKRECQILQLIASGLTNKQIADKLSISLKTVETHRTRIMQKLDLHTIADLTRYAVKAGLVK